MVLAPSHPPAVGSRLPVSSQLLRVLCHVEESLASSVLWSQQTGAGDGTEMMGLELVPLELAPQVAPGFCSVHSSPAASVGWPLMMPSAPAHVAHGRVGAVQAEFLERFWELGQGWSASCPSPTVASMLPTFSPRRTEW